MLKLLKSVARNRRGRGCGRAGDARRQRTPSRAPNRPEREGEKAAAVRAEGGERQRGGGGRQRARREPGGGAGSIGSPKPLRAVRTGEKRGGRTALQHGGEPDPPPVRLAGIHPVAARQHGAR